MILNSYMKELSVISNSRRNNIQELFKIIPDQHIELTTRKNKISNYIPEKKKIDVGKTKKKGLIEIMDEPLPQLKKENNSIKEENTSTEIDDEEKIQVNIKKLENNKQEGGFNEEDDIEGNDGDGDDIDDIDGNDGDGDDVEGDYLEEDDIDGGGDDVEIGGGDYLDVNGGDNIKKISITENQQEGGQPKSEDVKKIVVTSFF